MEPVEPPAGRVEPPVRRVEPAVRQELRVAPAEQRVPQAEPADRQELQRALAGWQAGRAELGAARVVAPAESRMVARPARAVGPARAPVAGATRPTGPGLASG